MFEFNSWKRFKKINNLTNKQVVEELRKLDDGKISKYAFLQKYNIKKNFNNSSLFMIDIRTSEAIYLGDLRSRYDNYCLYKKRKNIFYNFFYSIIDSIAI